MVKRKLFPGLRLAVLCAAAGCWPAHADALRFEQAFDVSREPATLHYQAAYSAGGMLHRVEVWRDGDRRVRRRTDGRVEVHASRDAGSDDFALSLLDLQKRIHTSVSRSNLYRIGSFIDWFDLAHGLRHPKGAYQLAGIAAPPGAGMPLQPCSWFELAQNGQASRICWSAHDQVPMLIVSGDGNVVWRIDALEQGPIAPEVFAIRDDGFLRNDANQDIEPD